MNYVGERGDGGPSVYEDMWVEDPESIDGIHTIAMHFNGCFLAVVMQGTLDGQQWERINTFKAVSGKDKQPDQLYENGPIPDGDYTFNLSSVEYRFEKSLFGGWANRSWANNERIRGGTSNEADAYGDYRVRLTNLKYDVEPKEPRSGFYLHGSQNGNGFGSAGCIDLGTATVCNGVIGGLYNYYQETNQDIKVSLRSKRTCKP